MKRLSLLLLMSITLLACNCKRSKVIYVPAGGGMETFYGHVKEITTENDIKTFTERDSYATIDLNKKGDSIEMSEESHGMIWITKVDAVYGPHGKITKMIEYHDLGHLGGDSFGRDPGYKQRRDSLAKQVAGIYTCDLNGHVIKYSPVPENSAVESYAYKYNADGDMIECDTYIKPIGLKYITKFTYDSSHMLIEEKKFLNKSLVIQANYDYLEFDSKNNWIKRKSSYASGFAGMGTETLIRKITYY